MTAAAEALVREENRLRALESVLAIARRKHEQAQADERQAEQQVAIEAEVTAVAQLKSVFLKVNQLLSDLEALVVDEVGPHLTRPAAS